MTQSSATDLMSGLLRDLGGYLRYLQEEGVTELAGIGAAGMPAETAGAGAPDAGAELARIAAAVKACRNCALHESRTQAVPGQGCARPDLVFVGEAPGADEDRQGQAFVGAAGQLLTKMIGAMGFTREEVFIGNIVKCRPPGNRTPLPHEMERCLPYLKAQLAVLRPRVIVALGATAVRGLLDVSTGITRLRGRWMLFEGIDVMPTYHPAYLLRNAAAKREVWADLKAVLKRLGREPPKREARS